MSLLKHLLGRFRSARLQREFLKSLSGGDAGGVTRCLARGADGDITINVMGVKMKPVHVAAAAGHADVVGTLLAAGSDKESRDGHGMTPLMIAANMGHESVVIALVAAGADAGASVPGLMRQAIHLASMNGHTAVVTALLKAGVSPNVIDADGKTPLHYAAGGGHTRLVDALLAAGADITGLGPDITGLGPGSPLDLAEQQGHGAVVKLLRVRALRILENELRKMQNEAPADLRVQRDRLAPTLLEAVGNENFGIYRSEGHRTACKACGRMMYHGMNGSDDDLCWIDVNGRQVWLCRDCKGKILEEEAKTPEYRMARQRGR